MNAVEDFDQTPSDFDTDIAGFTARQMEAVEWLDSGFIKFLLYGGCLGGGKSRFLRWYCVRHLLKLHARGIHNAVAMLACEDYPSLKDRQLAKIATEFPSWLGKIHGDHKEYGRCFIINPMIGSGVLCFRNLDDPSKYQSAEFCLIAVDELTKNPLEVFTFLRTRLRWPGLTDIECPFIAGTNPGGIGHGWVKQFWMDKDFPIEWVTPRDYRSQFMYVPSKAEDNPYLDQAYWDMLSTLPEHLRGPFKDGDWDTFVGQAFSELKKTTHSMKPLWPLPDNVTLYMTYDWGYGRPFSIGWWFVNNDGKLVRFAEWYGWNGTPNEGVRLIDSEIARGIKDREERMKINNRKIMRLAGHDCFQKRPDYKGGGQGPSTAEIFAGEGVHLVVADANRELKIRAFRERLQVQPDGAPGLLVYETCQQFWRTIPNLIVDKNDVEDVDTDGEDHVYDEACHICMARPIKPLMPKKEDPFHVQRIKALYSGVVTEEDEFTNYLATQGEPHRCMPGRFVETIHDPNFNA